MVLQVPCLVPCRFHILRSYLHGSNSGFDTTSKHFIGEDMGMEMKMPVEKAKKRALELMCKGYH
jgi:hypothetical protein